MRHGLEIKLHQPTQEELPDDTAARVTAKLTGKVCNVCHTAEQLIEVGISSIKRIICRDCLSMAKQMEKWSRS